MNKHNRFLPEMIRQACINVGYVNNDVYEQFPGDYIPKTVVVFDHIEKKMADGEKIVYRKDVKEEFKRIEAAYRANGWKPKKKKTGDPVRMSERMFLKLEGMKEVTGGRSRSRLKRDETGEGSMEFIQQSPGCSDF